MWIRDITQAYTQSTTFLQQLILAHLPKEIQHLYPNNFIMVIIKALYRILEAGIYQFSTYHNHYTEQLKMVTSMYNPCLLISTTKEAFGMVGMQTDDTLIIGTCKFSILDDLSMFEEWQKRAWSSNCFQPCVAMHQAAQLRFCSGVAD